MALSTPIMERFELTKVCNSLLVRLNESTAKSNIVKLGIDVQLPDSYEGSPNDLRNALHCLVEFMATALVNGLVEIKINLLSQHGSEISVQVQLTGRGQNRLSSSGKTMLQTALDNTKFDITHHVTEEELLFEFRLIMRAIGNEILPGRLPFENKKILLAEDNEINAMVFSSFLEEWGCEYIVATNGAEASSLAHDQEFDAILMDIFMPVLNGNDATGRIRQFDPDIPIIALTASTREEDIRGAVAAGANDYLLKPVSSTKLFQVLSKYL